MKLAEKVIGAIKEGDNPYLAKVMSQHVYVDHAKIVLGDAREKLTKAIGKGDEAEIKTARDGVVQARAKLEKENEKLADYIKKSKG